MTTQSKLLCLLVLTLFSSCASEQSDASEEILPVSLIVSADLVLPQGGQIELEVAYLLMADLAVFGSRVDPAESVLGESLARLGNWMLPSAHAHAGHSHGEAELTGAIDHAQAIALSAEGEEFGVMQLYEGHYFDARFELDKDESGRTLYVKGTVTSGGEQYALELAVSAPSTVAGLELASYVLTNRENTIEIRLLLGDLIGALDLASMADAEGSVRILGEADPGYTELKIGLKDRLNYVDVGTL
jgi:hypothetical protein